MRSPEPFFTEGEPCQNPESAWIVALFHPRLPDHFWTGDGLSAKRSDAKRFAEKAEAFAEWNDYCRVYPAWEAELREADRA